jgi:hypothetical protein
MKPIRSFVERHQFATFIVLAYLLSWLTVLPTEGLLLPHGPFFAALIVVWIIGDRAGLKDFVKRVFRRGAGTPWYALALALPIGITFTAAGLNLLLGAAAPATIDWSQPFVVLPIMLLLSGMWEEPGWTGYALPHLLDRFAKHRSGIWITSGLMAVIRLGWHLPLMLYGQIYWTDIVTIIAVQFIFVWFYTHTARSVLPIMLLHLVNNTVSGEFVTPWFTGADWVRYFWLLAALWCVVAALILLVSKLDEPRRARSTHADAALPDHPVPSA